MKTYDAALGRYISLRCKGKHVLVRAEDDCEPSWQLVQEADESVVLRPIGPERDAPVRHLDPAALGRLMAREESHTKDAFLITLPRHLLGVETVETPAAKAPLFSAEEKATIVAGLIAIALVMAGLVVVACWA